LALIGDLEREHGAAPPLIAARLIAASALARRESRGAHFRADFAQTEAEGRRTFTHLAELSRPQQAAE
jgi:L-aspartate oxidase